MRSSSRSSVPYFGFIPSGLLICVSILLLGSTSRAVNAVVMLIGALGVTEGAALAANWHGSADEFAARLQSGERSLLAFLSPWLVRMVLGPGMAVLGAIALWGGVRYF